MVICHVITALGFGGAEKLLVDLVNVQVKKDKVHIIYLKGEPLIVPLIADNVSIHRIDLNRGVVNELRKRIDGIAPDVIHTHVAHADFIGLWASRHLTMKKFCTMHNIRYKQNALDHFIFFCYSILFKLVAKDCKIIAISQVVFDHVNKRLRVPESRIRLLYNAIPSVVLTGDKDELRKELKIEKSAFCVLFVGRLEIAKSVDTLIEATKLLKGKIPKLVVVIVGDGSLKGALMKLAIKSNVETVVRFAGITTAPEKYFAASDVFVLPSVFEGFGMVIIEAFRALLPVVATNIQGPKELITNDVNGLLFEPKDWRILSEKIEALYLSPKKRILLGENGHKFYKNNFDILDYEKRMQILYNE